MRYLDSHFFNGQIPRMTTSQPTTLITTRSMLEQPKKNLSSLYCQGSTLPEVIYIGMITTTEHNPFHPNFFHPPSYSLQMHEEYFLTTSIFPLVYLTNPYSDYSISKIPGKKDHLTINVLFQLNYLNGIRTEEVNLLKFKRNNNLPHWYLSSRYHIALN